MMSIQTKELIMKNFPIFLTSVLNITLVFILLAIAIPTIQARASDETPGSTSASTSKTNETVCNTSRSVQVSGTAVINVAPDRALIQLGVQSNGVTTGAVEMLNTTTTQAVIQAIRALGIEAKDIATDIYVIEPIYENYDSLFIKGYRINNVIAVTLRDVNKTSRVIASALRAGSNQVVNIDFYTSELRKYRDQARDLAMKAAYEKAQALAEAGGSEAGCVLSISENSWSGYNGWWYGRSQNQNQWTQNVVQNIAPNSASGNTSPDEPISLGQISVKAEINASFSLK
jgi:uncharacterized protein